MHFDKDRILPMKQQLRIAILAAIFILTYPNKSFSAVSHWTEREHPGEVPQDQWGWDFSSEHYRYLPPYWAGPKETLEVFESAAEWGSNSADICYGFYSIGNEVYAGNAEVEVLTGPRRAHSYWTLMDNLNLHKRLHSKGMCVHWIPNSMWVRRKDFDDFIETMYSIGSLQFDCLHLDWDEMQDGMGFEQMWLFPPGLANRVFLPFNPGAYFYFLESGGFSDARPNFMVMLATGGAAHDDQTVGPGLGRGIEKRNGLEYMVSQIEAIEYVGLDGQCSLARPDWVQKSLHDTLRHSYLNLENKSYSAFWYVMAPTLSAPTGAQSKDAAWRTMVMSIDPIRGAWAGRLDATGADGRKPRFRRLEVPASTVYLQNNYFRTYLFPEQSGGRLVYDPSCSGHYDANSEAVILSDDFLETVAGAEPMFRDLEPVDFQFDEPGGYYAKLTSRAQWVSWSGPMIKVNEKRTWTSGSDTPAFRVTIDFLQHGQPSAFGTRLKIPFYDRLKTPGGDFENQVRVDFSSPIILLDSSGKLPDLALMVDSEKKTSVEFVPGQSLTLWYEPGAREHRVDIVVAVLNGLYEEKDLPHLAEGLRQEPQQFVLQPQETLIIPNNLSIPQVKIVQVEGWHQRPFFAQENGWWIARNAQKCFNEPDKSYVKVYLPSNGSARLRPDAFIEASVKPGWGCQNLVAIRDVEPKPRKFVPMQSDVGASCEIKVLRVTPLVFSPRVEFAQPIKEAKLNGEDWRYFDENILFLPNKKEVYKVKVIYGNGTAPHLTRTMSLIRSASWKDSTLSLDAQLPVWMRSLPEDEYLYAAVKHLGLHLTSLKGAELVRETPANASVIRFNQFGEIQLAFSTELEEIIGRPQPIDVLEDVDSYLSRKQARDLAMYLADRKVEFIDLRKVALGEPDLSRFGAILWNHFFKKDLPQLASDPQVIQVFKDYLRAGGGLGLFSRATDFVTILGIEEVGPDCHYISPHSLNYSNADVAANNYGLRINDGYRQSPLFDGLIVFADERIPLVPVNWSSALRFKGWTNERNPQNGKVLAEFMMTSGFESPVSSGVVHWEHGQGRVLACSFNPAWSYTSRDTRLHDKRFSLPLDSLELENVEIPVATKIDHNGVQFIHNVVEYIGNKPNEEPVGVIHW